MSKRTFPWIIASAGIALLGLIAMQLTWIAAAVELEESRFARQVQDVLRDAVDNVEQTEMAADIVQFIAADSLMGHTIIVNTDTINGEDQLLRDSGAAAALQYLRLITTELGEFRTDRLADDDDYDGGSDVRVQVYRGGTADSVNVDLDMQTHVRTTQIRLSDESSFEIGAELPGSIDQEINITWQSDSGDSALPSAAVLDHLEGLDSNVRLIVGMPESDDTTELYSHRANKRVRAIARTSDRLLRELTTTAMTADQRIDTSVLRSRLNDDFTRRGIDMPFNMSIEPLHQADAATTGKAYRAVLFPRDVLRPSEFLTVEFPDQQNHILMSMGFNLGASLLFLLLLIACFAFTLHALIRQKKISDIKTDFINNMTHEFKTPISTISLASEALLEPTVADRGDRVQRFASVIFAENKRLEHQVERALQAAIMDRGELNLHLQRFDIHRLVRAAAETLGVRLEQVGGQLDLRLDANEFNIVGDEVHLANVIYNLLDNAEKYSPEKPRITVRTFNRPGILLVEVSDKGLGLSREARRRIFDKFYRVPTGNVHDVKGFGLGLSYVRDIVLAHGGSVDVRSESGAGSTFCLSFPVDGPPPGKHDVALNAAGDVNKATDKPQEEKI